MAKFEQALVVNREEFIATRVATLRHIGAELAKRGDKYFVARQHAYFLTAYADCKCEKHSCSGCAITLGVASQLEKDLDGLDPIRLDIEEAKASAKWTRIWAEFREYVMRVSGRARRLKDDREGKTERVRGTSVRQAEQEAAQ